MDTTLFIGPLEKWNGSSGYPLQYEFSLSSSSNSINSDYFIRDKEWNKILLYIYIFFSISMKIKFWKIEINIAE